MAKERSASTTVIGPVVISFPTLDKPKAMDDSDKLKYSARFYIRKDDKENLDKIKKAMMAAAKAFETGYKGKKIGVGDFKWALRDADKERANGKEHGPESKGCYFINASSETPPGVVDRNKKPIIDIKGEIFPGELVYSSINFFGYNIKGNYGVGAGLNNVLKYGGGERIAGKPSAEQDFAEIEFEDIVEDEEFTFDTDDDEPDFTL